MFWLVECFDCQYDAVIRSDMPVPICPICLADRGRQKSLRRVREALPSDKPEGQDARKADA